MKTIAFKLIATLFVAAISLGFTSCGDDDESGTGNKTDETADVIEKDGVLQVNVKTAGDFATLIGETRKYQTGKLKVSGFINGEDFRCIRDMMITANGGRLEYLDMSDASIVAGGGSYILHDNTKYDYDDYKTQNNFISESMFEDCDAIQELILPNSVVRISHYMFGSSWDCNIRSITIGRSTVGSIDHDEDDVLGALAWMDKLEEINVHADNPKFASDKGIMYNKDKSILYNVPPMYKNSLSFPNSLQTIAGYAFRGYAASSIKLPSSVKKLENRAFMYSEIKSIDIGSVSEIGELVFFGCKKTENIVLSELITRIPRSTFCLCTALSSITIPQSVRFIGKNAFESCDNLRNIYMESSTPPIGDYEVESCDDVFCLTPYKSINLYVPKGSKSKYLATIPWSELNIIEK